MLPDMRWIPANDGEEALECILAENYDLIVLDLNLPGMDGMEILEGTQTEKMRRQRFLYCQQEDRSQIKWKDWMQGQMIIWKNRFICRSLKRVSEA